MAQTINNCRNISSDQDDTNGDLTSPSLHLTIPHAGVQWEVVAVLVLTNGRTGGPGGGWSPQSQGIPAPPVPPTTHPETDLTPHTTRGC